MAREQAYDEQMKDRDQENLQHRQKWSANMMQEKTAAPGTKKESW